MLQMSHSWLEMTTKSLTRLAVLPGPRVWSLRLALQPCKAPPSGNRQRRTVTYVLILPNLPPNLSIARSLQVPLFPSIHVGGSLAKTITEQQRSQALQAPSLRHFPGNPRPELQHLNRTNGSSERSLGRDGWERAMNTRCAGRIPGCPRASWGTLSDCYGSLRPDINHDLSRGDWHVQARNARHPTRYTLNLFYKNDYSFLCHLR